MGPERMRVMLAIMVMALAAVAIGRQVGLMLLFVSSR